MDFLWRSAVLDDQITFTRNIPENLKPVNQQQKNTKEFNFRNRNIERDSRRAAGAARERAEQSRAERLPGAGE